MSMEQVNAWGSYEQTAKNARSLSRDGDVRARRRSSAYSVQEQSRDVEAQTVSERSRSEYGTSWSRHFGTLDVDRIKPAGDTPEKQVKFTKEPEVANLLKDDPEEQDLLANQVRKIFGVYFEGVKETKSDTKQEVSWWSYVMAVNATMPWVRGYIKREAANLYYRRVLLFTEMCLRGISQVYFQNNPVSGLLILVGMFVQSSRVATHGAIAVASGNLSAQLLGFDRGLIKSGLFGYNAFLVGLALATFYTPNEHRDYYGPVLLATVIFSGFSSVLFVMMGKLLVPYKSPPLTLPFNVATLMFLLATAKMLRVDFDPVHPPALPDYSETGDTGVLEVKKFFAGVVRGIGQVYLADNIASGLLVLAGIAVCSRIAAVAAFLGSALGALIALATGVPADAIEYGFYCFNSSLSVTAMFMFYAPSWGTAVLGVLAGILTVGGQQALSTLLEPFGLPFMTLPFCVVALPFIIIQGTTNLVVAIPLASMTIPEDHLKRVKMLTDGFHFLKDAISPDDDDDVFNHNRKTRKYVRQLSQSISPESENDAEEKRRYVFGRKKADYSLRDASWVSDSAIEIFDSIDVEKTGEIVAAQFEDTLKAAGLTDRTGLQFATKIFCLMDLDESQTVTQEEFIAFAQASRALYHVRGRIAKFFQFVDVDHNGFIDLEELDAARDYLGQPALSEEEREGLTRMNGVRDGFEVNDIINFVTVAMVQIFVTAHHNRTDVSVSGGSSHRSAKTAALEVSTGAAQQ